MTSLPRLAKCSRYRSPTAEMVTVRQGDDDVARYGGLQLCGSVWACPKCSAAIREGRAAEIEAAGRVHLSQQGGVEFLTLTMPHDSTDKLAATLRTVAKCWTTVLQSRAWRAAKAAHGLDCVRAVEITRGRNGWHPHLHVLLFTGRPLTDDERAAIAGAIAAAWGAAVVKNGYRQPSTAHGVKLQAVYGRGGTDALAQYLTKVQDDLGQARDVAREIARGDLKAGRRRSSLTPFEILERAVAGDPTSRALWREYEKATHGRAALTWSQGLKARLLAQVPDVTDDELAARAPGEVVLTITDDQWRLVTRYRWESRLLRWVERTGGGEERLGEFLRPLHVRAVMDARRRALQYATVQGAIVP